tara:strand:+ start:379 stop:768 length:390 start_codon:yes stop_codon:yes gene_type:complete
MSKFLKLVQENTPGENAGKGPYTVEYKDMQGNVMAKLTILDDVGSSYDNFLKFAEVTQGDLEVASEQPVEDQESILSDKERDALTVASNLVKDPKKRMMGRDPKKALEKSLGDMYRGLARKVEDVAKDL